LESLNIAETRMLRGVEGDGLSWRKYDQVFRDAIWRLEIAGADFVIMASTTPQMRLSAIRDGLDIPIVSILDATARAVVRNGGKRALVPGTPVAMRGSVYPQALRDCGVDVLSVDTEDDITALETVIDNELYRGEIDAARKHFDGFLTSPHRCAVRFGLPSLH
jgi:aspartate racemase